MTSVPNENLTGMDTVPHPYWEWTQRLAICAAAVANFTDHAEHNEPVDPRWVLDAADEMLGIASEIAVEEGQHLLELYASRLGAIERRSALAVGGFSGESEARAATTWRQLQLVQTDHDRLFHPDVVGLMKSQQLQHYALHLTKIAGAVARRCTHESVSEEIIRRRLPDMLLFALKLHTVMNSKLADAVLPFAAIAGSALDEPVHPNDYASIGS